MATSDSKVIALQPAPQDPERLDKLLQDIGSAICTMKRLASQGDDHGNAEALLSAIESLAAQAGYLTDTAIRMTGDHPGVVGNYEEWLRLSN